MFSNLHKKGSEVSIRTFQLRLFFALRILLFTHLLTCEIFAILEQLLIKLFISFLSHPYSFTNPFSSRHKTLSSSYHTSSANSKIASIKIFHIRIISTFSCDLLFKFFPSEFNRLKSISIDSFPHYFRRGHLN